MSTSQVAALPPSTHPSKLQYQSTRPPQNASPGTPRTIRRPAPRKPSGLGKIITASTPNLRGIFTGASPSNTNAPPVPPLQLQRKGSHAALTSNSLAALPDASESYALATLNNSSPSTRTNNKMVPSPLTPRVGAAAAGNPMVGDTVDVPGNMQGTVRFVGTVGGRKGTFAGIELHPQFAPKGKNNGDVDGCVDLPTPRAHSPCELLCANTLKTQYFLLHYECRRRRHLRPPQ